MPDRASFYRTLFVDVFQPGLLLLRLLTCRFTAMTGCCSAHIPVRAAMIPNAGTILYFPSGLPVRLCGAKQQSRGPGPDLIGVINAPLRGTLTHLLLRCRLHSCCLIKASHALLEDIIQSSSTPSRLLRHCQKPVHFPEKHSNVPQPSCPAQHAAR